jgi:hypothetical protein
MYVIEIISLEDNRHTKAERWSQSTALAPNRAERAAEMPKVEREHDDVISGEGSQGVKGATGNGKGPL